MGKKNKTAYPVEYWKDTNEPITYSINQVDIEIDIPEPISVPEAALNLPPTQYELFTNDEQIVARNITKQYSNLGMVFKTRLAPADSVPTATT